MLPQDLRGFIEDGIDFTTIDSANSVRLIRHSVIVPHFPTPGHKVIQRKASGFQGFVDDDMQ